MAVVFALAHSGFGRRRELVGLTVVVALGIGVAIASLEAAKRTQGAYPSYLRRAEVGELVVNPSLITERVEGIIASTAGVRSYASHTSLLATPDRGRPRTQGEVDSGVTQLLFSTDGRYLEQDRPVVHRGRMIRRGAEAFVSVETARALALELGDALPLAFWVPSYVVPGLEKSTGVVEPIGRTEVTVVGIGVFADEVLVDQLYARQRILVTPEVGSAFDCSPRLPAADDPRPLEELAAVLGPPRCALTYRYYSLLVDGGDAGARAVADDLAVRFTEANERLPAALRAADIGYAVIPTLSAEDRREVAGSLEPVVRALQLFGVAAGATTLVVVLLGAARLARRNEVEARVWLELGATRAQRMGGILIPLGAAAVAGLAGSLMVGWAGSAIGPVASARSVDPSARLGLSGPVTLVALGVSAAVLAAGLLLVATRTATTKAAPASRRANGRSGAVPGSSSPALSTGVRAAVLSVGAKALLAACVVAVTAVATTTVFTTSLTGFVDEPRRFGWPYDAAAMVGFGYGGADEDAIAATLDRPEVRAWGLAALDTGSTIDDQPVPLIAARKGFDDLPLTVIEGELPVDDDEIALGALTADRLGLQVGDKARLTTPDGDQQATVRGIVVLPSVGPFEADRVSLGTGALLSARFVDRILEDAEAEGGLEPGALADAGSFVVMDLRDGVDSEQFLAGISADLAGWDVNGFRPFTYPSPVRPAPVADVSAMRAVPGALAGVFTFAMVVGLGVGIAGATRGRRRELAILRALGCTGRQLRSSVRWHALTVVGVGLVLGVPAGVVLGRASYRAFASGLGFFPEPVVSARWTAVLVVAALGMGLLTAAGPARRVARSGAALVLRDE